MYLFGSALHFCSRVYALWMLAYISAYIREQEHAVLRTDTDGDEPNGQRGCEASESVSTRERQTGGIAMQLYSIASGSSGNCIYAGDDGRGFLVDVGTSFKKVREGLCGQGLSLDRLDGILITHEHSDHIAGLAALLRKVPLPVYATADTIERIWEKCNMNNISPDLFHSVRKDEEFMVSDYIIKPFPISHDAADPVCYTLKKESSKVGIATDMGMYDDHIIEALGDCDAVLLEANHDISLLQVGPYPYSLKMRILGDKGHLSNDASAGLIKEILHSGLKTVVLGHLSEHNNFPELAYNTVCYEMETCDSWKQYAPELIVADRYEPTVPVAC